MPSRQVIRQLRIKAVRRAEAAARDLARGKKRVARNRKRDKKHSKE